MQAVTTIERAPADVVRRLAGRDCWRNWRSKIEHDGTPRYWDGPLFTDGGSRLPCYSSFASGTHLLFMVTYYHDYMEVYVFHMARKSRDF